VRTSCANAANAASTMPDCDCAVGCLVFAGLAAFFELRVFAGRFLGFRGFRNARDVGAMMSFPNPQPACHGPGAGVTQEAL
jgi:hypothetical protein